MIRCDEDALICDLAETYHIYDYRSLPCKMVATFSAGLRENSRIKLKLAGMEHSLEAGLLASCVDNLSLLVWSKTKDAEHNRNRPVSIYKQMFFPDQANDNKNLRTFVSGEAFEEARRRLKEGGQ